MRSVVHIAVLLSACLLQGCPGSKATNGGHGIGPLDTATVTRPSIPLPRAHAHNDYQHDRPLLDALDRGFCSVEADIFLVDGALLVAHWQFQTSASRTLQSLYLDLLQWRVRANGGRVHKGGPVFTLLIDIKSDGEATYAALRKVLEGYSDMLTTFKDGEVEERAVTVVVSGERPRKTIEAEAVRLVAVDGRLDDLSSGASGQLITLVSDDWSEHFSWDGDGPMPDDERHKLRGIVKKAHAQGRRVRFWATPESTALWGELLEAGVDHINTDELGRLQEFLLKQK